MTHFLAAFLKRDLNLIPNGDCFLSFETFSESDRFDDEVHGGDPKIKPNPYHPFWSNYRVFGPPKRRHITAFKNW